jgi:hypothetical protein
VKGIKKMKRTVRDKDKGKNYFSRENTSVHVLKSNDHVTYLDSFIPQNDEMEPCMSWPFYSTSLLSHTINIKAYHFIIHNVCI